MKMIRRKTENIQFVGKQRRQSHITLYQFSLLSKFFRLSY